MKTFLNLPVKDLGRSTEFFTNLGFSFDPQFSDEKAGCLVIGEDSYVMLLSEPFFQNFTTKSIADATQSTEAIVALAADDRQQVDTLADRALETGGQPANEPAEQDGMYVRSFQDPDGHLWEIFFMDMSAVPQA